MLVDNRVVFITGASRGIGQAAAVIFAKHGARLVLHARETKSLQQTIAKIQEVSASSPFVVTYDVQEYDSLKNAFQLIRKEIGKLDVLINNAGIMEESMLGMIREDMVNRTMQTNLQSVLYHMQFASRLMMRQKQGSIINVSSIIGTNGSEGNAVYAASKAGVIGATKSAAKELAPFNIRVNAVAPGFIATDLTNRYKGGSLEKIVENNIKMKRIGQPEDVANVMLFLASDLSSYVTGQVIGVDGGMVI
ncbi:SDR family NAD(P)-dependent oxidoreductase [Thermaerobacillus caldiproteolyticus]|uniref:SDR family NAD(P)-dependent oxidoreductase n=1 Tax=Thermaerobacillus caldiproteolyticus TaxID=247480 RepID=UPI00188CF4A4|nr:glucose 1-dehydrogenase [Anoxybacillus caldiproteolyticus]QPA30706.1 SDR family oxidoreductase [Anoxybacillus caldiproteolyticus]